MFLVAGEMQEKYRRNAGEIFINKSSNIKGLFDITGEAGDFLY